MVEVKELEWKERENLCEGIARLGMPLIQGGLGGRHINLEISSSISKMQLPVL